VASLYEGPVQRLIDELGRLPGIGPKSAQRIAFHILRIAPEVVDPDDIEMLQDLVVAAIHDANRIAQAKQSESMGGLTGGVDLSAFGLG